MGGCKNQKAHFTLVPIRTRIGVGSTLLVRDKHFFEQSLIPATVYVPVLHRVRYIRRLDQMFNDDGRLPVRVGGQRPVVGGGDATIVVVGPGFGKGLVPPRIAQRLQIFVHNVSGHDRS